MRSNRWIEHEKEREFILGNWIDDVDVEVMKYITDHVHVLSELELLGERLYEESKQSEDGLTLEQVKKVMETMSFETSPEMSYFKEMMEEVILMKAHGEFFAGEMVGIYCDKCGCWLPSYTKGRLHYCKCKELAVDGTAHYTRICTNNKNPIMLDANEVIANKKGL